MLPQILMIGLMCANFGMHVAKHGEEREDTYSMWWSLVGAGISGGLLYWGGFFDPMLG